MADSLSIAGSVASIAGLGVTCTQTFAQWWQRRRGDKKNATIRHYLDWLRRREYSDLVQQIQDSKEASSDLSALIKTLSTSSEEQTATLLAQLEFQSEQLNSIARDIGDTQAMVGDVPGEVYRRLSPDIEKLQQAITDVSERTLPSDEDQEYEERYRKAVAAALDEVDLFGVDIALEARQQQLSAAYISLSLGSVTGAEGAGPAPAEQVFDSLNLAAGRLLIRGDAGSGKTTLMRWAAIRAAARDDTLDGPIKGILVRFQQEFKACAPGGEYLSPVIEDAQGLVKLQTGDIRKIVIQHAWTRRVPFLISVRDCKKGRFPPIEQYPLQIGEEHGAPPSRWTQRVLERGRALILIDGIDETPPSYRPEIRKQVKKLTELYSGCYFILTTRPSAVEDDWLADLGFRESLVAPLTGDDRDKFVDKWHEAVEAQLVKRDKPEDLSPLAAKLKKELRDNTGVGRLATTPLLAAMVCALHRDRQQKLPESQYELVEALCHMLTYRRERESGLDLSEFPAEYRDLSYPQRRAILQRLAHYLVTQELSALEVKLAKKKIAESLQMIRGRKSSEAAMVLNGLIERSGMLCEKSHGSIDFIHNTFKEYLAARQFVQDDDVTRLADKAVGGEWDNVLLFAAATPDSPEFATKLIGKVAPRPSTKSDGPKAGRRSKPALVADYRRRMMAVRMRAVAEHLDGPLEQRVRKMEKQVFPPRTLTDAAALAQAGAGMERYLRYRPKMGVKSKVACVRALRLLDTDAAKYNLEAYLDDKNWPVVEELSQALNPLRIGEVVRRVRQQRNYGQLEKERAVRDRIDNLAPLVEVVGIQNLVLQYTRVTDLTPLAGMRELRTLILSFVPVTDLKPLAQLTDLQMLDLFGTPVADLTPLARLSALQALDLTITPVANLTPLVQLSGLQTLSLRTTQVVDLTPLARLSALQALDLGITPVANLMPLAQLSGLQSLEFDNTKVTDLTALEKLIRLQTLDFHGTRVRDLNPLARLRELRFLNLSYTQVADLKPLAQLSGLQTLGLRKTMVTDLKPLAQLRALHELDLMHAQVTDLKPLAQLSALQSLDLRGTKVTDLTPLAHLKDLNIIT